MKDPAFLFYSGDFLSGTMLMSDEEVGQYIRLLCLQHQKGHLREKDMISICKECNEEIYWKNDGMANIRIELDTDQSLLKAEWVQLFHEFSKESKKT